MPDAFGREPRGGSFSLTTVGSVGAGQEIRMASVHITTPRKMRKQPWEHTTDRNEMKVTKKQLRRIIKEEKRKILREGPGAERAMGLYADTAAVNAVHTALNDLVEGAYHSASQDLGSAEHGEAQDAAQQVFVNVVQDAARSMGYSDVADALETHAVKETR